MEPLSSLFLGALLVGVVFCIASVLLGFGHLGLDHLGLHLGADGAGHAGGHGLAGHGVDNAGSQALAAHISPWNLTCLMAFIAWFGGTGYLALGGFQLAAWISLLVACAGGIVGWAVIYLFFKQVLLRGETRMDPADYRLEGTVARVTLPISDQQIGEIQYTKGGSRRSEGARSLDGAALERGVEVVIVKYDHGIAYVEPWQTFVEEDRAR